MKTSTSIRSAVLAVLSVSLVACATRVERPDLAMPASFEVADPAAATQEIRTDWWEGFGSSQLSQWLDEDLG